MIFRSRPGHERTSIQASKRDVPFFCCNRRNFPLPGTLILPEGLDLGNGGLRAQTIARASA
jgi:hypothetical protein